MAVTNGNELPFLAHRYTLLWRSELPLIVKIFLLFWTKNYALGPKFKLNIKNLNNFKGFNFLYVVLTISIVYIKILISFFSVIWPKKRPKGKCHGSTGHGQDRNTAVCLPEPEFVDFLMIPGNRNQFSVWGYHNLDVAAR